MWAGSLVIPPELGICWVSGTSMGQMINNRHANRSAARLARSATTRTPGTTLSRIVVTAFALLALTIQMVAVQSHIHHSSPAHHALTGGPLAHSPDEGTGSSSGTQHHKYPDDQDPAKCPFCQQLGHSGQFVAGSVILVPVRCCITFLAVEFTESTKALYAVRHSWQSRAPPQQ